jgi:hypothetical protein
MSDIKELDEIVAGIFQKIQDELDAAFQAELSKLTTEAPMTPSDEAMRKEEA